MRIIGFSIEWEKLHLELPVEDRPDFTSFRFERRDKDWQVGEQVQVFYKPRSKILRRPLGNAMIVTKEPKSITEVTFFEAIQDGFDSHAEMVKWFLRAHQPVQLVRQLYKLTLRWTS